MESAADILLSRDPDRLRAELDLSIKRIGELLARCGAPSTCKGCGARIIWMRHLDASKNVPYDPDGVNHFITCPQAGRFRKRTKRNDTRTHDDGQLAAE
jgi:hypothetical protein